MYWRSASLLAIVLLLLLCFWLDRDDIDDKRHQGEQHPYLLKAHGIGRAPKGGIKADEQIRHQGTQHIVRAHERYGIVVERPSIACRPPHEHRETSHQGNQQAIDQGKLCDTLA